MKRRNKINVWLDEANDDNAKAFFSKTVSHYSEGNYEDALEGFKKLSKYFDTDKKNLIIPHIEKCRRVLKKRRSSLDIHHLKNQAILQHFGWVDRMKYFTGVASIAFFALLTGDDEGGPTFVDNLFEHPLFVLLAVAFAFMTYLLHQSMKRFTISEGLIRCKYCGKYISYIDPNSRGYGTFSDNACNKCGRMYPVPDFYWDGWQGLEYMNSRQSVSDEEFYIEYNLLKNKLPINPVPSNEGI